MVTKLPYNQNMQAKPSDTETSGYRRIMRGFDKGMKLGEISVTGRNTNEEMKRWPKLQIKFVFLHAKS